MSTTTAKATRAWAEDATVVADRLGVDIARGLSQEEAARRLAEHGPNQLSETRKRPAWVLFLSQFADLMVGLLAAAAVIGAVVGDWHDSLLIGLIVVANATIGFLQQQRAEAAVAALKKLSQPNAKVWRDGQLREIPARDLTVGDVVELRPGDMTPADLRILEAADLQTNEGPLTGESFPVDKQAAPVAEETPLAERQSMAWSGTAVVRGRGKGLVCAVGMQTELGHIATMLDQAKASRTPLEHRLHQLSKRLALVVVVVCVALFLAGMMGQGISSWEQMLMVAVSLAVAAIPEGLPAVITVSLARGSQQLSRRKAIVRQLAAVETLGSVSVICTDKTGTLTLNDMALADLVPAAPGDAPQERLLRAMVLCNDAQENDDGWSGSATERALVVGASKYGVKVRELRSAWPRIGEFPFGSDRKRMSTIHRHPDGQQVVYVKGAVESVLERSRAVAAGTGEEPLTPERRAKIQAAAEELAARGRRVLGVARATVQAGERLASVDDAERDLTFLGYVGIVDPLRPDVGHSVDQCHRAGIRVVMITGDHPGTARSIGEELKLLQGPEDRVLTGPEFDRLSDEELKTQIHQIGVFARVTPAHKLRIVQAHQARGNVVSMTGDGVNDAPALKQADIGVAMGITGTDVSKEAARMILADDNFSTIVAAVEEGRVVYDNIRKFVRYLLTTNTGEILTLFVAVLLQWPIPLLPVHLLWINLVTDGLPALALGFEPAERGLMDRPPRRRDESILAGGLGRSILWMGSWMAACCLLLHEYGPALTGVSIADPEADEAYRRTIVFFTLAQFQLFYVLSLRSSIDFFWSLGVWSNYRLIGAVVIGTVLQVAIVYLPLGNRWFHTTPLSWQTLVLCLVTAASAMVLTELGKLRRRWMRAN